MSLTVTVLTLLSRFSYGLGMFYACVPNTHFIQNERVCTCDSLGRWSEENCDVQRRQICLPGKIIWHDCTQCICQENGQLICSAAGCNEGDGTTQPTVNFRSTASSLSVFIGSACTPYRKYYVECSMCTCPVTGRTRDAVCIAESVCSVKEYGSMNGLKSYLDTGMRIKCVPKAMYLFHCYNCLCPVSGRISVDECRDKCITPGGLGIPRLEDPNGLPCKPNTFYKKGCNVCFCPDNGKRNAVLCTHNACNGHQNLNIMRSDLKECLPHSFTRPRCLYCECSIYGNVNNDACLELNCLKSIQYSIIERKTCTAGEMVPICIECFCLSNGTTVNNYCSKTCSYQQKINILENVLKDNLKNYQLVDKNKIKKPVNELCEPNTVYVDDGRYCLCPDNGNTHFKLCTNITEDYDQELFYTGNKEYEVKINFNASCTPSTFVEFECNTCFCSKQGKIDPNWCTYDNCEMKTTVQKSQKPYRSRTNENTIELCNPGSITVVNCNFCICPDSGISKEIVCTKNECSGTTKTTSSNNFSCEPSAYYLVDCNICYCPQNGEKNVEKCTKNFCESNFLRSDYCAPGQLFSNECNVCICPPNGDKTDKVCTNKTCTENVAWKQIFRLSESLLGTYLAESTRNLDLCFPGDEFVDGCKLCSCPDMGLRYYATCYDMLCESKDKDDFKRSIESKEIGPSSGTSFQEPFWDLRRSLSSSCYSFNFTLKPEREDCTPGTMYVIRCRQCICPYMGNINDFCRPLPQGTYCEQPYPYFNYLPMGRRTSEDNSSTYNEDTTLVDEEIIRNGTVEYHDHTLYKCTKAGHLIDQCFICECDEVNHVFILEHCFKSNATECTSAIPTFLSKDNIT